MKGEEEDYGGKCMYPGEKGRVRKREDWPEKREAEKMKGKDQEPEQGWREGGRRKKKEQTCQESE